MPAPLVAGLAAGAGRGLLSGVGRGLAAMGNPATTAGKVTLGADLGLAFGPAAASGAGGVVTARERQYKEFLLAMQERPEQMQARMSRLQQSMQTNEARLATLRPDVYTELMIGRKLAPGTRVYGPMKDRELLEQVLMEMSQ